MRKKLDNIMENAYIGLKDINGKKILNGDKIHVQFVNYMNSDKEEIAEEFEGKVMYHKFNAMFLIWRPDKVSGVAHSEEEKQTYIFNHRSMRIRKL